MTTTPVQLLTHQVLQHWRTSAPNRYQHLRQSGALHQAAQNTARQLKKAINSWTASGLTSRQAWEKARRLDLLNLPSEAMPGNDLMDLMATLQSLLRDLENEAS